ncbi:glycosyltransferase family 2 protein [Dactylosporangium sp. CA-139066]|uniref:glycosyltransferase family 2 protein n=1 Tax=Dactylosporangium sp. CA-139066 TaxID=3239930 RepID=UPI003D8B0D30
MSGVSIVVPTLGRPSLRALLDALSALPPAVELLLVDDRRDRAAPLPGGAKVLTGRAQAGRGGPAAARNIGWRAARHEWVVFLDDDVVPAAGWYDDLLADLDVDPGVGGVQGRVEVPLPAHRRPTDWERGTAALSGGAWITADMAYRRAALAAAGGFDERFPRAYREDADLAHRVRAGGWRLVRGRRTVTHPVRPAGPLASLRAQRGNADDALLRRLHGPGWRAHLEIPRGRRARHAAVVAAGLTALGAAALPRRWRPLAVGAGLAWAAGTAELAAARIAPGPRTPAEIAAMTATSVAIPPLAVGHWLAGRWRWRSAGPWPIDGAGER